MLQKKLKLSNCSSEVIRIKSHQVVVYMYDAETAEKEQQIVLKLASYFIAVICML